MRMKLFDYKIYEGGSNIEPIIEFCRISGDDDYLLKVEVVDMQVTDIIENKLMV
jgi:hypothetical protein